MAPIPPPEERNDEKIPTVIKYAYDWGIAPQSVVNFMEGGGKI